MTENPYACSDGRIIGRRGEAWNEGYDQAKEEDARYLESFHFGHMAGMIRAEKKVSS